jgi:hypothetical protein
LVSWCPVASSTQVGGRLGAALLGSHDTTTVCSRSVAHLLSGEPLLSARHLTRVVVVGARAKKSQQPIFIVFAATNASTTVDPRLFFRPPSLQAANNNESNDSHSSNPTFESLVQAQRLLLQCLHPSSPLRGKLIQFSKFLSFPPRT